MNAPEWAGFLTLPETAKALDGALANVEQAVVNVAGGGDTLLRAFLPLVTVGSTFLPQLTQGVGALSSRFAQFMTQAERTGQLPETTTPNALAIPPSVRSTAGSRAAPNGATCPANSAKNRSWTVALNRSTAAFIPTTSRANALADGDSPFRASSKAATSPDSPADRASPTPRTASLRVPNAATPARAAAGSRAARDAAP